MKYFLSIVIGSMIVTSWACDHCNVYLTNEQDGYSTSFSFFHRYRQMCGEYDLFGTNVSTRHAAHGNDPAFWGNKITEHYHTFECRGDVRIWEDLKLTWILPYVTNQQNIEAYQKYNVTGIGDPTLLITGRPFRTTGKNKNQKMNATHHLETGIGIKFPLGKTDLQFEDGIPNLDLQPGSGSWDYLTVLRYTLMKNAFKMTGTTIYRFNTTNRDGYAYGTSMNATIVLSYQTNIKKISFIPQVGAYAELAGYDHSTIEHKDTGGRIMYLTTGFQLERGPFRFFSDFQYATTNRMNGESQLLTNFRINSGLTFELTR